MQMSKNFSENLFILLPNTDWVTAEQFEFHTDESSGFGGIFSILFCQKC